jgi:hypothetical protein
MKPTIIVTVLHTKKKQEQEQRCMYLKIRNEAAITPLIRCGENQTELTFNYNK